MDNISELRFEGAMERLDQIITQMEEGEMPLEQSIALYEQSVRLASHLRALLDAAQARLTELKEDGEEKEISFPEDAT